MRLGGHPQPAAPLRAGPPGAVQATCRFAKAPGAGPGAQDPVLPGQPRLQEIGALGQRCPDCPRSARPTALPSFGSRERTRRRPPSREALGSAPRRRAASRAARSRASPRASLRPPAKSGLRAAAGDESARGRRSAGGGASGTEGGQDGGAHGAVLLVGGLGAAVRGPGQPGGAGEAWRRRPVLPCRTGEGPQPSRSSECCQGASAREQWGKLRQLRACLAYWAQCLTS